MRQPVYKCHKFTSSRFYGLYFSSVTAVTALACAVVGIQPVFAQTKLVTSPGNDSLQDSQFGFGGLLPVPRSPVVRGRRVSGQIPSPPSESTNSHGSGLTQFGTTLGTTAGTAANSAVRSPAPSLESLEQAAIQQQGRGNSVTKKTPVQPVPVANALSPVRGASPTPFLGSPGDSKLVGKNSFQSVGFDLAKNPTSKQADNKTQSPISNLFASDNIGTTTEFVAPGAPILNNPPTNNPPTFNELLNSPRVGSPSTGYPNTGYPSAVAPLPPLPGETAQSNLIGSGMGNSAPTFNQLLGSRYGSPAYRPSQIGQNQIGTNPPTFNQLINNQPTNQPAPQLGQYQHTVPNQTAANPTFSQLFNSQGGTQPSLNDPIVQNTQPSLFPGNGNPNTLQNRPFVRSTALAQPSLTLQGVYVTQGDDQSARARLSGILPLTPNALFGATLDLTSDGSSFDDSRREGLNINELFFATSLGGLPNLRFTIGQMDLTSYFDRNSFAKDGASHFFNPVFQTNPALAASGISSRTGLLVNWSVNDNIDAKAAVFSSSDKLSDFALDGFAGEVGVRYGNAIIRGTYVTDRDAGNRDSFAESFQLARGNDRFGPQSDDREEAYGLNAEVFIPNLKMGLFGRYGRFENRDLGRGADTYVLGASFLDLFTPDDRLGIAYGRELSNDSLRRGEYPDVVELFYDFKFLSNLRLGFTVQGRDSFEETVLGVRVKTEFDVTPRGRIER